MTGLAPGQVLRSEPSPDSVEVETTLFPYVELAAPDLPWLYTPAAPGEQGLRPWLVLVVVREQEGVSLDTPSGSLPLLRIEAPAVAADELPDLAEAWAWAHVQSLVGLDGVAAAVAAGTGEVVARLLCPRRLLPDSAWIACVVPAFDGGVLAGRGERCACGTDWQPGVGSRCRTRSRDHCRSTTSGASVRARGRLRDACAVDSSPDDSGVAFGLQPIDVSDPGLVMPFRQAGAARLRGRAADARCRAAPMGRQAQGRVPVRPWRNCSTRSTQRADVQPPAPGAPYDPATQDPVVGPPLYGKWAAGVGAVPARVGCAS